MASGCALSTHTPFRNTSPIAGKYHSPAGTGQPAGLLSTFGLTVGFAGFGAGLSAAAATGLAAGFFSADAAGFLSGAAAGLAAVSGLALACRTAGLAAGFAPASVFGAAAPSGFFAASFAFLACLAGFCCSVSAATA